METKKYYQEVIKKPRTKRKTKNKFLKSILSLTLVLTIAIPILFAKAAPWAYNTDKASELSPTLSYKSANLDNGDTASKYQPQSVTNASVDIVVTNEVLGVASTNKIFTFNLKQVDQNGNNIASPYTDTTTVQGSGEFKFTLTNLIAGTYYYKIYEDNTPDVGWTYDNHECFFKVTVVDNSDGTTVAYLGDAPTWEIVEAAPTPSPIDWNQQFQWAGPKLDYTPYTFDEVPGGAFNCYDSDLYGPNHFVAPVVYQKTLYNRTTAKWEGLAYNKEAAISVALANANLGVRMSDADFNVLFELPNCDAEQRDWLMGWAAQVYGMQNKYAPYGYTWSLTDFSTWPDNTQQDNMVGGVLGTSWYLRNEIETCWPSASDDLKKVFVVLKKLADEDFLTTFSGTAPTLTSSFTPISNDIGVISFSYSSNGSVSASELANSEFILSWPSDANVIIKKNGIEISGLSTSVNLIDKIEVKYLDSTNVKFSIEDKNSFADGDVQTIMLRNGGGPATIIGGSAINSDNTPDFAQPLIGAYLNFVNPKSELTIDFTKSASIATTCSTFTNTYEQPSTTPTPTPNITPEPTPSISPTPTPDITPAPTPDVTPTPTEEMLYTTNYQGGTVVRSENNLTAFPKKGYVFGGWYKKDKLISKDINYKYVGNDFENIIPKFISANNLSVTPPKTGDFNILIIGITSIISFAGIVLARKKKLV